MAKQLYDYWFVQFDFPNEEGKPYKSSGGKMVWNDKLKREIPEGWDCMCIGDYAKCKGGYAFKSKDFTSKGTPVIKIGNIQEDYTLNMVDSQCINDFDNSLFIARKYDLVIAMTGATIGKFAISPKEYLVNQRVGRFDLGKSPLGRLGYLFNSLKQEYFREQVFQIASGCAQPNISSEQIDSIVVLKPKMSVLNNFNQLCEPILEQQVENILQIELLTKQRDELLPLLMNGQVSVNYHLANKNNVVNTLFRAKLLTLYKIGLNMSENLKLWDIIDSFISGDWGNEEESPEVPCCVSCIRGADIVPICNSDFDNIPIRYISNRSFTTHCLQEGDIIVEKSGGSPTQSTGRVVYISKELLAAKNNIVCSNFCVAFRVKPEWNPKYIYYYLCNIYNTGAFFNFEGKTSGLKNLQVEAAFKAIPIKKIAIEEQASIANTLSTIESKLAVNRQINDNLEAMAKQLYDYWFVQFDFPNEEGKPYKSSGGKMVWNEKLKREIPEGWNVVNLIDFAEIKNGATPSTANPLNYGGDIIWITPKDLSDQQSKFVYRGERNISQLGYDSCSTNLLPANSVLLSSRAPIGLVSIAKAELCTNQGFKNLVPHDANNSLYLYYYIKYHIRQIEQLGTGTTFKEVSREDLCKFPILMPCNTLGYLVWVERMTQIADEQFILTKEIATLTKQRDELLPLLMNGQVSVNYHLSHD